MLPERCRPTLGCRDSCSCVSTCFFHKYIFFIIQCFIFLTPDTSTRRHCKKFHFPNNRSQISGCSGEHADFGNKQRVVKKY